ncbi:MAG: S-adenosylmethionine:tRNA ribosyltransferase-isomerase [Bacteroidaceae bacterium]|nr:S-adenosylmethionine:tRNA ribosyltransferase-isomerase [Bacteroidaceae bacterium]
MTDTRNIEIAEYDYALPDERIAKYPLARRDSSKLLLYKGGSVSQDTFCNLPEHIPAGSLMVFNNTKVIQARLRFRKETGATIEIFCLEPEAPNDYQLIFQQTRECVWQCLVGNSARWKSGELKQTFTINGREVRLTAERLCAGAVNSVRFAWDGAFSFAEVLEAAGELPIPPYLNRRTEEGDKETYQTVYSKIKGSVAAPTAGLHFTPEVLGALADKGVALAEVTLHVGAGTFKPVKSDSIGEHTMHEEYIEVSLSLVEALIAADGRGVVAVGTTSVRTLESLYFLGEAVSENPDIAADELFVSQWVPYEREHTIAPVEALEALTAYMRRNAMERLHTYTQIIIAPGYRYNIVKAIVTNFHQPKSTLLLLVSAFVKGDWRRIYDYALANDFRFLSYGDSSLLVP